MKKAFTMMELIFVIVVIGILAVVIMPRTGSNKLYEAATQVLSHIRYTQHLAMVDDKFDTNDTLWFRENWQIQFESLTQVGYMIYSDKNHLGNASDDELAKDPLSGEAISHATGVADLKKKYGITQVQFADACDDGKELSFDFLGRPYTFITISAPPTSNIYQYLLTSNCDITLTGSEGTTATIRVHPETGYACILNDAGTGCI